MLAWQSKQNIPPFAIALQQILFSKISYFLNEDKSKHLSDEQNSSTHIFSDKKQKRMIRHEINPHRRFHVPGASGRSGGGGSWAIQRPEAIGGGDVEGGMIGKDEGDKLEEEIVELSDGFEIEEGEQIVERLARRRGG